MSRVPGKASKIRIIVFVPQTDTGGQGEKPKANGRTLVKELGKIASVTLGYGLPCVAQGNSKYEILKPKPRKTTL